MKNDHLFTHPINNTDVAPCLLDSYISYLVTSFDHIEFYMVMIRQCCVHRLIGKPLSYKKKLFRLF